MIAFGKGTGSGVILESPTRVASWDRAAEIRYAPDALKSSINMQWP